jgi:hypothetical protein
VIGTKENGFTTQQFATVSVFHNPMGPSRNNILPFKATKFLVGGLW